MIDFAAAGNVVGVEIIGQQEFSIRELLKWVPIEASDAVLNETRYVAAAELQPAWKKPSCETAVFDAERRGTKT